MENIWQPLLKASFIAFAVESALMGIFSTKIWKWLAKTWVGSFVSKPTAAIIASLFLCFSWQYDVFAVLMGGEQEVSTMGMVLTSFLLSRGSNVISDVVKEKKRVKKLLLETKELEIKNGNGNGEKK